MSFRGYDVLEIEPDGGRERDDEFRRRFAILDAGGARAAYAIDEPGRIVRTLRWTAIGRAEIAVARAFVDARKGRLNPFWLPSLTRDLTLTGTPPGFGGTTTVKACGYAANVFPLGNGARYIWAWSPIVYTTKAYVKVTGAVDNGNGTETLTHEVWGVNVQAPWIVGRLRFCRMEDDVARFSYGPAAKVATIEIPFREIMFEAPV